MIRRLSVLFLMMLLGLSVLVNPSNAQTYMIDINDADASVTEAGWTALNALHTGSGSIVTIDGIPFEIFSADGARIRGGVATPNPNALTGDFVFDDGSGQSVGMYFGGAGDLPSGVYQVDVYIYDAGAVILDQIVGWRRNGVENVVGSNFLPDATNPSATFEFFCDGIGRYDVFVRENNTGDRTRLNAVKLTYLRVPEPGSAALLLGVAAVGAFALRRTWRA